MGNDVNAAEVMRNELIVDTGLTWQCKSSLRLAVVDSSSRFEEGSKGK